VLQNGAMVNQNIRKTGKRQMAKAEKLEFIKKKDKLLAMVIRDRYSCEGVDFITPNDYSQQVAYMHHPAGKVIDAHIHNLVHRNVVLTQEVLFIKKGKLRVDFYDDYEDYLESIVLQTGDVILLVSGGHGFVVLEEVEMIEVKQGPYSGDADKKRFSGIDEGEIVYRK
jgi:mannose-6-phosphate isomerase-like protein (cupin superfamily)